MNIHDSFRLPPRQIYCQERCTGPQLFKINMILWSFLSLCKVAQQPTSSCTPERAVLTEIPTDYRSHFLHNIHRGFLEMVLFGLGKSTLRSESEDYDNNKSALMPRYWTAPPHHPQACFITASRHHVCMYMQECIVTWCCIHTICSVLVQQCFCVHTDLN